MLVVNIQDNETNLLSLLAKIERSDEEIIICRNGKPIADLHRHQSKNRTEAHPTLSKIQTNYDPVEILTKDEWPEESSIQ
ncbi:MAG: type II toxin-antitoxin system prevent-host-death family antitoxin [Methylococcales bacterium]|jgi:antitoxin (DNA-binding transcriptional repressor) of toxin-antitoxin stability system|nr:type II toxin-antitoxin system prevent-host-death family antitoxin [Methylococcales bacterium]MBT7409200.1 type II toxin-antitoxin system prevent-host-death family antitoxin [Methylococcales bacterium]